MKRIVCDTIRIGDDITRKAQWAARFVGRAYAEAKPDIEALAGGYLYPVVSKGLIIAIYECDTDSAGPYAGKPIVDDDYIDADAADEEDEMPKNPRTKWAELPHGYNPGEAEDLRLWLRDQEPDLDAEQCSYGCSMQFAAYAVGDLDLARLDGQAIAIDPHQFAEDGSLTAKAGWRVSAGMVYVDSEGFAFEVVEA